MNRLVAFALTAALPMVAAPAYAQQPDFDEVEIRTEVVAPGVAVLFGQGGNIAVGFGEDGTIMIDDQFAPLSEKIEAAVAALGAKPVKYLINTHWHFDHTGGNENFSKNGVTIFAHENVRVRMESGGTVAGREIPPASKDALPLVSYEQGITFNLNGDSIVVAQVGGGHTDGDSVVGWLDTNVVHMGDLYFNIPGYPFIDVDSGGNVYNLLGSLDLIIALIDEETVVIPGHGPVSNRAEMVAYRDMISTALSRLEVLFDEGKSLEEAIAAKPLADFDRGEGFVGADAFVTAIWRSMES